MKVCTDACLFGAWLADELENENAGRLLDIGTGTGLLALIIAQKVDASIDAVEIDAEAFHQAEDNFSNSPWSNRLNIFHTPVQQFHPDYKYDIIISNPPFNSNDLRSPDKRRNAALHGSELTAQELLENVKRLLKPGGMFAVLTGARQGELLEKLYNRYDLHLIRKIVVKQDVEKQPFRFIHLTNNGSMPSREEQEILIKHINGEYTNHFRALLKDYYL